MDELKPFTHRIYVDFSGDDGDYKKQGSSRCICIAWVASAEEDIHHNEGMVLKIKKIIKCRPKDEIKYTSLRRHFSKKEALQLLNQLKINVVVIAVLKERIKDETLKNPKTKKLVDLIQTFPLHWLIDPIMKEHPDMYFQLIFDRVGWGGCEKDILRIFKEDENLGWGKERPDWLVFTKSGSQLMLQLADIVAGLSREYVESLQGQKLPACTVCATKGKPDRPCKYRLGKLLLPSAELMKLLYPLLLKNEQGKAWEHGFAIRPPAACREYKFVDCIFGNK